MPKVSVSLLNLVCITASAKGVERHKLLEQIEVDEKILENPDNYISCIELGKAMQVATELTGDPNFCLENGQNFEPGNLNVVGYLIANAPTLRRAYEMKLRYKQLIGEGVYWKVEETQEHLIINFDLVKELDAYKRYTTESCLASLVSFKRRLLGKQVNPLAVYLNYPRPEGVIGYESFFKCDVHFNAEKSKVVYPASLLDEKIVHSNAELFSMFQNYADDFLDRFTRKNSISRKVSKLLLEFIPQNRASLENVAEKFAVSARTLQRRLKNEGQTFNEILGNVRRELASRHLQNTELSIAEISYLLGFSEPSIFHRTFKKWTGSTPRDYRREMIAA